jgi:hypothetical protein
MPPTLAGVRTGIGRPVDRRVACAAFGLAVLVLASVAGLSGASEPALARRDPAAALELFRLLRAGERSNYIVDFTFTRVRSSDGRHLTSSIIGARYGRALLTRGGGSLTVELPTLVYDCQRVERRSSCTKRPQSASISPSQAVGVEILLGAYDAVRIGDANLAGERARCFRVRAHSPRDEVPGLGRETILCLAADGIPLRTRVVSALSTDEREATRVRRDIDDAALAALLAGFDTAAPKLSR